jgi:hypothetical protein
MSSVEDLTLLLQRLRANNENIAAVGNVSSAFSDWCWGMYKADFYTYIVQKCDKLIPQPDYPSLKPEIEVFTAACNLTVKNRTFRTAEGVDDVLITWTQLEPKLKKYKLFCQKDRSEYAHEQFHIIDIVEYWMEKFVSNYKDKKNVWAPRVKRST